MTKKDPNNLNAYHNRGQSDKSKGRYRPPNDVPLLDVLNLKHENAQRAAYKKGYGSGKKKS